MYSTRGFPRTILAVLLAASLSAVFSTAFTQSSRSGGGDLVPPLPADPARRAAALERIRTEAANRSAPLGGARVAIQPVPVEFRRIEGTGRRVRGVHPSGSRPGELTVPRIPRPRLSAPPAPGASASAPRPAIAEDGPSHSPTYVGKNFDAIDDTGWMPASPDIAAGPDHVMVVTNDVFAVYDKCGNWLDGGQIKDYFGLVTDATVYDPRVVYDEWDDRWVMAWMAGDFAGQDRWVYIFVSTGSDPTAGWMPVVTGAQSNTSFADNLYLAVDPETMYFVFDQFSFSSYSFTGFYMAILDKQDMYDYAFINGWSYSNQTNPGDASLAWGVRPAQMNSFSGEMYFVNNKPQGGSIATLWWLVGAPASPVLYKTNITLSPYTPPPHMQQSGGTYVDALDARYTDAVYSHGRLLAARTALYTYPTGDHGTVYFDEFDAGAHAYAGTVMLYYQTRDRAYPAFDLDEDDNIGIVMAESNDSMSPSIGIRVYDSTDWSFLLSHDLATGLAPYTLGGGGTPSNPYRWGNYFGADKDPVDDRTFWVVGTYASNDPAPSWTTRVGCYSAFPDANLDISPDEAKTAAGYAGYMPYPGEFTYTIANEGGMTANWAVSGVPYWLTPSSAAGQIPPGGSQDVTFTMNFTAQWLEVGEYAADLLFENCGGSSGAMLRHITLGVVDPIQCDGGTLFLRPEGVDQHWADGPGEFGVFVTAMEDVHICALAADVGGDYFPMTGRIYEADGTTRGALLVEGTQWTCDHLPGGFSGVPLDVTLQACQDYELVFEVADGRTWVYFDEGDFVAPYDIGGLIRVRNGSESGSAATTRLPAVVLMGTASDDVTDHTVDLFPSGPSAPEEGTDAENGLFITALENMDLLSVGFEADLNRGARVSIAVYNAIGEVRDGGVAEAYGDILVTETGMRHHEIPIYTPLEYGEDYDISVEFDGPGYWQIINEVDATLPDTAGGTVVVRRGEHWGTAYALIPHLSLKWKSTGTGGVGFDLAKLDGSTPGTGSGSIDHGAYVTALADQQVYGVGVMADIPEGSFLFARVYKADQAIDDRVLLLSEGVIKTSGTGMRWHDVPVALEWQGGKKYDVSVVCTAPGLYEYWDDTTGLPYDSYGTIRVRNGENGGWAGSTDLVHLRVHACDAVLTGVDARPPRLSSMFIGPAAPNPTGAAVTFEYSLDTPATADLEIYDVLGRRVATVFARRQVEGGPGSVTFDTGALQSGVYFVKLRTETKAVSRKFVVTH